MTPLKTPSISNLHSIVLVFELTKPAVRALNYAKLLKPESIEALAVDSGDDQIKKLRSCWQNAEYQRSSEHH